MQQIIIEGLKVDTLIGVYDWERTQLTTLIVDLVIDTDLTPAMVTDDVATTIDYAKLAEVIKAVGRASQFELLEALAGAIITAISNDFSVSKIDLTIIKPGILPDADKVAIRIVKEID